MEQVSDLLCSGPRKGRIQLKESPLARGILKPSPGPQSSRVVPAISPSKTLVRQLRRGWRRPTANPYRAADSPSALD
jgi:hypothetical protein